MHFGESGDVKSLARGSFVHIFDLGEIFFWLIFHAPREKETDGKKDPRHIKSMSTSLPSCRYVLKRSTTPCGRPAVKGALCAKCAKNGAAVRWAQAIVSEGAATPAETIAAPQTAVEEEANGSLMDVQEDLSVNLVSPPSGGRVTPSTEIEDWWKDVELVDKAEAICVEKGMGSSSRRWAEDILLYLAFTKGYGQFDFAEYAASLFQEFSFKTPKAKFWISVGGIWCDSATVLEERLGFFYKSFGSLTLAACRFLERLIENSNGKRKQKLEVKCQILLALYLRIREDAWGGFKSTVPTLLKVKEDSWLNSFPKVFPLEDCAFDTRSWERVNFNSSFGFTYKIPVTEVYQDGPPVESLQRVEHYFRRLLWREGREASDDEVAAFTTILAIYISGECRDKTFLILSGSGNNGKSLLLDVMKSLLGSRRGYIEGSSDIFQKTGPGAATPALGRIFGGRRLVGIREASTHSGVFNGDLIKNLTGNESVTYRNLYSDYTDAEMTAHFILVSNATNFTFDKYDDALGRRLRCLELPVRFEDFTAREWTQEEHGSKNILPIDSELASWMVGPEARNALFWLLMRRLRHHVESGKPELPAFPGMNDFTAQFAAASICSKVDLRAVMNDNLEQGQPEDLIPAKMLWEKLFPSTSRGREMSNVKFAEAMENLAKIPGGDFQFAYVKKFGNRAFYSGLRFSDPMYHEEAAGEVSRRRAAHSRK